jgi:hypothetical protein
LAEDIDQEQTLPEQWLTADYAEKRRILETVFLNCRLEDANLVPTMRKPFDILAEGLVSKNSRGDWTPLELFLAGIRALTLQVSIGNIAFIAALMPPT